MNCPHCGLTNPPSALVCDCGYRFSDGRMGATLLTEKQQPLSTLARAGFFLSGFFSLMLGILAFVVIVVVGAIVFNTYRRTLPAKASDAAQFFGYGIASSFALSLAMLLVGAVLKGPI